ncbi:MAG: hypothetical protein ACLPJW_12115 [Rhodomicrobium sp.]
MTLLSIVNSALGEIGSFGAPYTTIVGNTDPRAMQALALANKIGSALVREYSWQELKTDTTFLTSSDLNVSTQFSAYSLPSDLKRFVDLTFWDDTDRWPLLGPATDVEWQTLLGRLNPGGSRYWFRLAGGNLLTFPKASGIQTIAFTYQSTSWCQSSGGTKQTAWGADTDTGRLDEDMMTRGLNYEWRAAKGLPAQAALDDYNDAIDRLKFDDAPRSQIDFGATDMFRNRWPLLPDGNFGVV